MPPARSARLRLVATGAEARPEITDADLVAAFLAEAGGAAEALHDRVRPLIDRTVKRLLGGRSSDFDDLVQCALIEVVCSLGRWPSDGALDGWVTTIAARVVYKYIRRQRLERRIFSIDGGSDDLAAPPAARELHVRSVLRKLGAHLAALDERKAWAFMLHDVIGHDMNEVAEIMGASVAATQQRVARGRRELHLRIASDPELTEAVLDLGGES